MSALKHMEFIFGGMMALGCAFAALPAASVAPPPSQAAAVSQMQVVVIKGKRMTTLEKRRSLEPAPDAQRNTAGA